MDPSDPRLKEALAVEGILGKQRPGAFHIYQKKYCKFLDSGLTLAFANSKEHYGKNKIEGLIPLKDVLDIVSDEKPKKFQLILEGKVFKFECESPAEKMNWVNAVTVCRDHAITFEEQNQQQMMALDSEIRFEETVTTREARSSVNFNPFGVIASTAKKVVLETAIKTGVGIVKTSVNTVGKVMIDNKPKSNEEFLKAKKLNQTLDFVDKKILQSRLMMGYVSKETREATGLGLVDGLVNDSGIRDTIAKRWCLLISSKPIDFDAIDKDDEETLDNGKLPFEIEPETLYMYDGTCDESKPLENILLKDIVDITVKKKNPEEQYYRFVLDLGDKKIILLLSNITEMTKWVKAIQSSRANIKEKTKSKLPSVKNIYWLLKVMNEEGEAKTRARINNTYERLTVGAELSRNNNLKDLIRVQEKVASELVAVVNACLCHKDPKVEVIRLYLEIFHESILNAFRAYFRRNQDCLENKDIFEMVKFLIWFRGRLKLFGDAFADARITHGVNTLCRIVGIRILRNNMKAIKNIIKQEVDKEPEIDGRGRAATTTPNDVFKLANETFNVLSYCNTPELGLALLDTCSYTVQHFQSGLGYIIENYDVSLDHLAAFCNNTISYMNKVKEFAKQAEQIISVDKELIAEHFNEAQFNKVFVGQGKKFYEKIADRLFTPVNEQWSKISFLEINLEKSLNEALSQTNQLLEKVHSNFSNKIETSCLEKTVTFYVQAFLDSAEKKKFKNDDLKKVTKKLENDMKILQDLFSNLKTSVIESSTSPINGFLDFLTANYSFLSAAVQNMKEQYGTAIKWSTFELLIKLRNDQLGKDEKNELLSTCEEFYKSTQRKSTKDKTFNVFKHVEQSYDGVDSNSALSSSFTSSGGANSSFSMDDDTISETNVSMSSTSTAKSFSLTIEGYLDVEKDEFLSNVGGSILSNLKFEERYFNLKRDVLYFYKERHSEFSQGAYKLKEMVDSGVFDDDNNNMFFITLKVKDSENTRTIRFRASTPEKRDLWIEYIKEAAKLPDLGLMVELNASDVLFFKDKTKALFVDIEEMPTLEFAVPKPGRPTVGRPSVLGKGSVLTNASEEGGRRRRSFDLGGPIPIDDGQDGVRIGCVASICRIFGGSKKVDYGR